MNKLHYLSTLLVFSSLWTFAGPIEMRLTPTTSNSVAGEPIILMLMLTNASDEALTIELGHAGVDNVSFRVDTNSWHSNSLAQRSGLTPGSRLKLQGHSAAVDWVVLDEWLEVPPGVHVLTGRVGVGEGQILANVLIKVLPYDAAKLRERVGQLARRVNLKKGAAGSAQFKALRALYKRSPEGKRLLKDDLKLDQELIRHIEYDPVD